MLTINVTKNNIETQSDVFLVTAPISGGSGQQGGPTSYKLNGKPVSVTFVTAGSVKIVGRGQIDPDLYVIEVDKKEITKFVNFTTTNPPQPTNTDTKVEGLDNIKKDVGAFLDGITSKLNAASFNLGSLGTLSLEGKSALGKGGLWYNQLVWYITYTKAANRFTASSTIAQRIETLDEVEKATETAVMAAVKVFINQYFTDDAVNKTDSLTGKLLVDGQRGALGAQTQEKDIYEDIIDIADFLGIKALLVDSITKRITEQDISAPLLTPKKDEKSASATTAETDVDKAKTQIVSMLNALVVGIEAPDSWVKKGAVEVSNFKPGRRLNAEIRGLIKQIEENKAAITPTPLGDQNLSAADTLVFDAIKKEAPPALQKSLVETGNADGSALIRAGAGGSLSGNAKQLYDNCLAFADYLGFKKAFETISKGGSAPTPTAGTGEPQTQASGQTGQTGQTTADSATVGTSEEIEDTDSSEGSDLSGAEIAEPEGGKFALFYTVFRAEPDGLQINLKFSDGKSFTYEVPPGRVGTPIGLKIEPALAQAMADNSGSDVAVTITGKPSTGGKEITTAAQIAPVRWPVPTNRYLLGNLTFVMAKAAGKIDFSGLQADVGRGGAKDFEGGAGRVHEIFYTEGGGVDDAYVDCAVTASGRTYVFTFSSDPLLVPIEVNVKQDKIQKLQESKKRILNEAVPHWIFLRPGRSGGGAGGAGGSGSGGAGGAGKGSGGTGVNIAVTRIAIKTDVKWISIPNVGNPWDMGSLKIDISPGTGKSLSNTAPGAVNILCKDDLSALGLSEKEVRAKVANTLFKRSAAYLKMGLECWSDDPTVTGNSVSAVTKREITQSTVMSAR